MDSALLFAFTVGAVSSVNPCGFALLPAFFAHRLGVDHAPADSRVTGIAAGLLAGGIAAIGVVITFAVVGVGIMAGATWLGDALPWAGLTIGVVLIVIAGYVLFGRHVGLRVPLPISWGFVTGYRGDFLFGIGYGVASLSCTLPIFLSVVAIATTGSFGASILKLSAFGLGMGTVIVTIAVAAALSRNGLAVGLRRFLPYAERVGGLILLMAGSYVVYYWGSTLFSSNRIAAPSIVAGGERLSGWLVLVVGSETGKVILLFLLFMFVGGSAWMILRRWRRMMTSHDDARSMVDEREELR
ncbi:MAG: cytochrome c biogenesis CcdA family protein [Bauldia sp.]